VIVLFYIDILTWDHCNVTRSISRGGKFSADSDEGICLPRRDKDQHRKSRSTLPPLPPTPDQRPPLPSK